MISEENVFVIACCMYAISLSGRQCTNHVLHSVTVAACNHYHPAYSSIKLSDKWMQGFRENFPFLLFSPKSYLPSSREESIRLLQTLIGQKSQFRQWMQTVWMIVSVNPKFNKMEWNESYVGDMERILAKYAISTAL